MMNKSDYLLEINNEHDKISNCENPVIIKKSVELLIELLKKLSSIDNEFDYLKMADDLSDVIECDINREIIGHNYSYRQKKNNPSSVFGINMIHTQIFCAISDILK